MLSFWTPLLGDITQQGLSNYSITTVGSGATVNTNGKLGKCYYFDGTTNGYINTNFPTNVGTDDFTISLWVKIPTISSGSYYAICTSKTTTATSVGFGIYWNYSQKKFLWSTADGTNATEIWMADSVDSIVYDKWIHLVMVRNNSDAKKGYFYINGTRYELASVPAIRNIATASYLMIGKCTNGSYPCKMYVNDLRVYIGKALSPKEIRNLSLGIVCHYPLNGGGRGGDNIISGTSPNEVQYTYPSSRYSDKFSKISTIVPSASQYVLSFWAKSTHAGDKVRAHWCSPNTTTKSETNQGSISTATDGQIDFTLSDKWEKYWCVWTQSSTTAVKHFIFPRMFSQASGGATGTGTVSIKCVKLEEGNIPTPWIPNSADASYSAMGYDSTTEYDVSGYGNNGTKNGTFVYDTDTPRYSVCTKYSGSNYSYVTSPSSEIRTIAFWAKWDTIPSGQSILFVDGKSKTGFGLASNGIICSSNSVQTYTFNKSNLVANVWYHFVVVCPNGGSNTARKLYINGVEQTATSNQNYWSYSTEQLQIGKRSSSSDGLVGKMSDFRAYATALSAAQVAELYNTAVSVANNGTLMGYELIET